jgi:hypothetical protein
MTRERLSRAAAVAIALAFASGVAGAALRFANSEPVERSAQMAGDLAFGAVLAAPALLGLLAVRERPSLFVAAGVLSLVLAFLGLISLVGLVLVPQAILFFLAARRGGPSRISAVRSAVAIVTATLLGTLAFFALFQRDDPVCWATTRSGTTVRLDAGRSVNGITTSMDGADLPPGTTESGCTSDSISETEAVASVALIAVMLLASWTLTTPPAPSASPLPAQN